MSTRTVVIVISVGLLLAIATTATADDPVVFADPDLKEAVKRALGISTDPTPTQMEQLIKLEGVSSVSELGGLEYAINLQHLNLQGNPITHLEPLANLTKLGYLYSFRNRNCQNVTVKYPAVPIMRLIR